MARKSNIKKRVKKHLKEDIKMFKHEADEDRALIKKLKKEPAKKVGKAVRKSGDKYYAEKSDIRKGIEKENERKESKRHERLEAENKKKRAKKKAVKKRK